MKIKNKNSLKSAAVISSFVLVTLACSLTGSRLPEVTNHPPPEVSVITQPFEEAGCPLESGFQEHICPH